MDLQQEYENWLVNLDEKERKTYTQPTKIQKVLPLHIPANTTLAREILTPTGHAVTNLYNYANYRIRNAYTATDKEEWMMWDNEKETLEWANAATTRWKKNHSNTINRKIDKLKQDTRKDHSEEIKELRKEIKKIKKLDNLTDAEHRYINYYMMDCIMQHHNEETYRALPSAVAQEVLRQLARDWTSFFKSLNEYKKNPGNFTGCPKMPGKKTTGSISTYAYSQRGCSLHTDKKTGRQYITLAGSDEHLDIGETLLRKENYDDLKFQTVTVVPVQEGFDLLINYSFAAGALVAFNNRVAGADLGVDNLITLVSNAGDTRPLIVDGRTIKSTNRYYNMMNAKITSRYVGCSTSKKKKSLWAKRDTQMRNLLGQAANRVVKWLVENNICLLVVGYNKGWKADGSLARWRKDTKQSFVHIPHGRFVSYLRDKCAEAGIRLVLTEESYTSKASLVDGDYIPTYGVDDEMEGGFAFSGSRVSRGLYRSGETFLDNAPVSECGKRLGVVLNADVNGAGNILRKVVPSAFGGVSDWRFLLCPSREQLVFRV